MTTILYFHFAIGFCVVQVVTQRPLTWCDDPDHGITVIGNYEWSAINVSVSAKIENVDGVFIALR